MMFVALISLIAQTTKMQEQPRTLSVVKLLDRVVRIQQIRQETRPTCTTVRLLEQTGLRISWSGVV